MQTMPVENMVEVEDEAKPRAHQDRPTSSGLVLFLFSAAQFAILLCEAPCKAPLYSCHQIDQPFFLFADTAFFFPHRDEGLHSLFSCEFCLYDVMPVGHLASSPALV